MSTNLNDIPGKILPALLRLKRYLPLIVLLLFAGLYAFLVLRINTLTTSQPSETAVLEKLQTVQRPRIDQDAINKIKSLEDSNIQVQSLFNQARDNPFQE